MLQPLVDANMRELKLSGFMSNRGRQNVASFLTQNLNVDWRLGAAYFEETLIDHDVTANWGNWMFAAGLSGYGSPCPFRCPTWGAASLLSVCVLAKPLLAGACLKDTADRPTADRPTSVFMFDDVKGRFPVASDQKRAHLQRQGQQIQHLEAIQGLRRTG